MVIYNYGTHSGLDSHQLSQKTLKQKMETLVFFPPLKKSKLFSIFFLLAIYRGGEITALSFILTCVELAESSWWVRPSVVIGIVGIFVVVVVLVVVVVVVVDDGVFFFFILLLILISDLISLVVSTPTFVSIRSERA